MTNPTSDDSGRDPGHGGGTTSRATAREARQRSSLVRQSIRFVVLNLKILRLTRQHH